MYGELQNHPEALQVYFKAQYGLAPEEAPVPDVEAPWQDRPIGGLGWHLIRNLVDEIRYQTDGAENRLTLVKRLAETSGPGNE